MIVKRPYPHLSDRLLVFPIIIELFNNAYISKTRSLLGLHRKLIQNSLQNFRRYFGHDIPPAFSIQCVFYKGGQHTRNLTSHVSIRDMSNVIPCFYQNCH